MSLTETRPSQRLATKSHLAIEQAAAALRRGDPIDAERTLRQRLIQAPRDVEVLVRLADLLNERGDLLQASIAYKRALVVAPSADNVRLALSHLLDKLGQSEAALNEIQSLKGPLRGSIAARTLEAAAMGKLGLHDPEIAVYEELVRRLPQESALWMYLGNALKTVGRTDEAVGALRQAIKIRPSYGEAYWSLANLKTFRFERKDIMAMRKALKEKMGADDTLHFHFALGKALEDAGETENSFKHYAAGNAIRAAQYGPDNMQVSARANAVIETFTPALFARAEGHGNQSVDPIFVVGLQRSGSTLIEQILATHPSIEGTSELLVLEQMWLRLGTTKSAGGNPFRALEAMQPADLDALGAEYLERTRSFRLTDRPMFVDKLPANWLNIGFIQLILPNAKIIDARRHPLACGFSNFRQNYATGVTFSYSLEAIGRFYTDYLRVLKHFDAVRPGTVHHVINEQLIDDPEGTVRNLLKFVGVAFDPVCLEFHNNRRAVHSASSEQVRKPINRDGVDSWRRFEPWLEPLRTSLGIALEKWNQI